MTDTIKKPIKKIKKTVQNSVIVQRLQSETPPFWKKVFKICGIISAICTGIAAFDFLPMTWRIITAIAAAVFGGIASAAKMGTTDPKLAKK